MRSLKIKKILHKFGKSILIGGILIALASILISFFAFRFYANQDIQHSKISLDRSFQQYIAGLANAHWTIERLELLKSRSDKDDQKTLKVFESALLPALSFGVPSDHFFIRGEDRNTFIEAQKSVLVTKKSRLDILDEEELHQNGQNVYFRSCKVNLETFLCIIKSATFRDYVGPKEKYLAIAAISRQELNSIVKGRERPSSILMTQPDVRIDLEEKPSSRLSLFQPLRISEEVDKGFWVSATLSKAKFAFNTAILFLLSAFACLLSWFSVSTIVQRKLKKKIELESLKSEKRSLEQIRQITQSVIHDIRSPLFTLTLLSKDELDPERRSVFKLLIKRIKLIINDLETKKTTGNNTSDNQSHIPLHHILPVLIREKTEEFGSSIHIDFKNKGNSDAWAFGALSDCFRLFSNLINNSVEASKKGSRVEIDLDFQPNSPFIKVTVRDYGCGIPEEIQKNLFEAGFSHGKLKGSGLGLFSARMLAQKMDGDVSLSSKPKQGTEITVTLRASKRPKWAVNELNLSSYSDIVIIDDEETYQNSVKNKIKGGSGILHLFDHPSKVPTPLLENPNACFIVDNNYGEERSKGLSFIQKTNPRNCILFTADWNLREIQEEVTKIGARMLGKDFLDCI